MRTRLFFLSLSGFFLVIYFSGCKKDLVLNAPYQEIPSIYAVLNPQDKIQMIRINKVFLGEGDANQMAQNADSINYPAGELEVKLERFDDNGNKISASPNGKTEIIFHDSLITTTPGAFNTKQRIYVTGDKLFPDKTYKLTVKNLKSGKMFTAKSPALDSVMLSGYMPLRPPDYASVVANPSLGVIDPDNAFVDYADPGTSFTIRYKPNTAAIYQLTIRIHYIDSTETGNFAEYADYTFGRQTNKDATTFSQQSFLVNNFKRDDLLSGIASVVSKSTRPLAQIRGRKVYKARFMVMAATQDYYDYLQFAAPSLSIAQEKPIYSNFDGRAAIGIFTFRSRLMIEKAVSGNFVNAFGESSYTCPLRFVTYNGQRLCP